MNKNTKNINTKGIKTYFPLILSGIKTTGNLKDALSYIEEMLPTKVYNEVNMFLGFIHQVKDGKVGHGNIDGHYFAYKLAKIVKPFKINDLASEKPKQNKKIIRKNDDVFVLRDALDSFQGKHKVVAVDKNKNTITIQLGKDFQVE